MKKIIAPLVLMAMPMIAAAQSIQNILTTVKSMANSIVPLFMVIAVAVFLWGIIRYITSSGDEEKRKSAQGYIIYGLLGMFIMVAFWGIITLVSSSFGISTQPGTITPPNLP